MAKYKPKYAPGQVVVIFKRDYPGIREGQKREGSNKDFARGFGACLGYELAPEADYDDGYLFKTEPGKENQAISEFEQNEEVETAYRRDLRFEERHDMYERLKDAVESYYEAVEQECDTRKVDKSLDELVRLCEHAKKL